MISKKIVLCGSKGAGKTELLTALQDKKYPVVWDKFNPAWKEYAVDRLADYRTELQWAVGRAQFFSALQKDSILEASLIDNVAYAATRLTYIINDGTGTEEDQARWWLTLHTCSRMLRDGLNFDAIVYIPGHEEEEFYGKLEEGIVATIWEFIPDILPKYKLSGETVLQRVEEIDTIWKELDEPRTPDKESDGEDN